MKSNTNQISIPAYLREENLLATKVSPRVKSGVPRLKLCLPLRSTLRLIVPGDLEPAIALIGLPPVLGGGTISRRPLHSSGGDEVTRSSFLALSSNWITRLRCRPTLVTLNNLFYLSCFRAIGTCSILNGF